MTDLLSLFRSNLGDVRARMKKVQDDLESARRRREELRIQPLPAEEICDALMENLDRRAVWYEDNLKKRILSLSHDFIVNGAESPGAQNSAVLTSGQAITGQELEQMLVHLGRDLVRASLLKTIRGLGLKSGAPRAARVKQLAQVEIEIKELEIQDKKFQQEIDTWRKEIDG